MPMGMFPTRYRLPNKYNTAIGQTITRFAALEAALRHFIYAMLDLERELGRVAIKNPRMKDSWAMVQDIMSIRGFHTKIDMKLLTKNCIELEGWRDKLAHGSWVKHTGSSIPVLQVTSGTFPDGPGGKSFKARIRPVAFAVSLPALRSYARGINGARNAVRALAKEIVPQHEALQKKRLEQQARARWPKGLPWTQNPGKRKRPPRSWRA